MRLMTSFAAMAILALSLCQVNAQDSSDAYMIPEDTPVNIRGAVDSSARTDAQRARDAGRKPAEVMTLAEIGEGDHVIELAAFGNYYTTMLVEAVGPEGQVDMFDMPWTGRFGGEGARALEAAHANATYQAVHYNEADFPENVDVVLNILFYHDLTRESAAESVDTADMNAKIFAALKPGGLYLIVDHEAEDGSGWRDAGTLHRIDIDTIRNEVTRAGFSLLIESELLDHPEDDRTAPIRSPGIRGATDRAVLLFRKPAR